MTFQRAIAFLLPTLTISTFVHCGWILFLLSRYHGINDFQYFDLHRHHVPVLPLLLASVPIFIVLPSLLAVWLAARHPFPLLECWAGLISNGFALGISLLANLFLALVGALASLGGHNGRF